MARASVSVPEPYYDDSGEEAGLTAEGMGDLFDGATESDASMENDDGQESVAADGRSKAGKVAGKRPKRSHGKPDMERLEQERRLEKKQRRKVKDDKDRSWEDLNAKSAREHGKITLRTIAELTTMKQAAESAGQDFQFMKVGTRFSCKEEVLLRIAEMNEFGRHQWTVNTRIKNAAGHAGRNSLQTVVAVCPNKACSYVPNKKGRGKGGKAQGRS